VLSSDSDIFCLLKKLFLTLEKGILFLLFIISFSSGILLLFNSVCFLFNFSKFC